MTKDFFEIRPILPEDKIPLQVGLQMLSPESIRQRFFANKKAFTEEELKFLTEVDQINHLAFVAVYHNGLEQLPAGVIRAIKKAEKPTYAEIGITIVDLYQGKGIGAKLFEEIAKRAESVGITHFYGDYHTSNLKMTKLLEKFSKSRAPMYLKHTGGGFIYFEAPLKN
ncbi:MAG: GNAT family N-acetyltransferase [Bdellovibrionales bacterium]|nr:GNAT family N-acetyltransferase [Bdellovibrionales bacterium]